MSIILYKVRSLAGSKPVSWQNEMYCLINREETIVLITFGIVIFSPESSFGSLVP